MYIYERLVEAWAEMGVGQVVGTQIHPAWGERFKCFQHHDDLVCVAYAAGWCVASAFRPVAVVLDVAYVSCDELEGALRGVRHLPLVVCVLGKVANKLGFNDDFFRVRHARCVHVRLVGGLEDECPPGLLGVVREEKKAVCFARVDEMLRASRRPVLLLGDGLTRFACGKTPFPIVVGAVGSLRFVATDDPYFIGKHGRTGDRAGNMAVQNADLVLVLGGVDLETRPEWFAREAQVAWVSDVPVPSGLHPATHFDCHPDFFVRHWQQNPVWNDWVYQCRRWKSRWLLEMPPTTDGVLGAYAFHALLQQHYAPLCQHIVARPDRFLWCPLYQQFITGEEHEQARRLWAAPFRDVLAAACGVCDAVRARVVVFLPQDNAFSYERISVIQQENTPLLMFIVGVGKKRFRMNGDGLYDTVDDDDGIFLEEISSIPILYLNADNLYEGLSALVGAQGPMFVWVECDPCFQPCPLAGLEGPVEDMMPDPETTRHEMLVAPVEC